MDKPPPDDLDVYVSSEDPVDGSPQQEQEQQQQQNSKNHHRQEDFELTPLHALIPEALRKRLFTGSCCLGVAVLYMISMWDHGILPGAPSPFAAASGTQALSNDVTELYVLMMASDMRDLMASRCRHLDDERTFRILTEQIESLQRKYKSRTGENYPYISCPADK